MSQRHAAWNYVIQLAPVVLGIGLLLIATSARTMPALFFIAMLSSYFLGLTLFLSQRHPCFGSVSSSLGGVPKCRCGIVGPIEPDMP
jgi:hypothetical protein